VSTATPPAPTSAPGFAELGVPPELVASLARGDITEAFPIQAATLPDSLAGADVLGRGRTGSGKTVAFSVPLVARLAASDARRQAHRPRGLVLVPTRELAAQVADTLGPLARAVNLDVVTVVGGVSQGPQVKALRRGVDVVVATPGRLDDLIGQRECRLDAVEVTVLDEADHMADLGFLPVVRKLLDATPRNGQRLLFSATLDGGVDVLVRRYLDSPVTHEVDSADSPVPAMTHHVLKVASGDKAAVVRQLASGSSRSLLFTRTKYGAKKLAARLTRDGIPSVELHGNLSQAARSRNLDEFASGRARVLVATDIAARGIHVDDVGLVVHVDPPAEHKAYLHRSGRTARAGADGVVVTVMIPNQQRDVASLTRAAGIRPVTTEVTPGHSLLAELVGPAAERVAFSPSVAPDSPRRPSPRHTARSKARSGAQARSGGGRTRHGNGSSNGNGTSRSGSGGGKRRGTSGPRKTSSPGSTARDRTSEGTGDGRRRKPAAKRKGGPGGEVSRSSARAGGGGSGRGRPGGRSRTAASRRSR